MKTNQITTMVIAILLLRLLFIFIMGPMPQDAYYFFYSQHPALSYFDHPPMIAVILRLFTTIFGQNVIAIKLASSCVTLLTVILFYHAAKCFLGTEGATKAVLLLLSTFMVTILSLVATPDTPLLMYWVLSIYLLYQAIFKHKNSYWIWAGIAMGLAFDSKYTGIFLPAGLILFLLFSNKYRQQLISKWLWLSAALFLVMVLPVFIWNLDNNFASFKFQGTSRMNSASEMHLQVKYFLGLLGHQSFIIIPVLLIAIFYFVFRILKKYKFNILQLPPEQLFLLCFFLPIIGSFTFLSFVCWVKLNWLMPGYLTGIILISIYIPQKWVSRQVIFSLSLHILLAVELVFYPFPVHSDDTWYGWEQLAQQVTTLKKEHPDAFVFSADGYKTSAELNLLTTGFTYSQNILGQHALEFDYVNADLSKLKGKNAFYIDSEPGFTNNEMGDQSPEYLLRYFKSVKELPPILIRKNDRVVRKFLVYYCSDYR
ncbi:glycosyltransferase family 39 protein [Pedobacter sp. PAMC26386]|nr:glycosyltransferase family 39 protein [Pedobacter sp. PAMC26386]